MKLKDLLKSVKIIDTNMNLDIVIERIASDSRKIGKKDVFVAIHGESKDGNDFIFDALEKGAFAVITDKKCESKDIPYILVENARGTLARMWSNFYDNPTKNMKIISITGTNGKSSTAEFLYSILKASGKRCGLISTIRCLINNEELDIGGGSEVSDKYSAMTTPDPEILYYIFKLMKEKNVEYVVLETSSHALKQRKLDGLDILIGAFTNLSHEHLDYHKSMDDYCKAKELLLEKSEKCIINIDDCYGKFLYSKYLHKAYSVSCMQKSDFYANGIYCDEKGCKFTFGFNNDNLCIKTKICGNFAVYNALMAISIAKMVGIDNKSIENGILSVEAIKGRLEKYRDKSIYIDYAHTPYATKLVLESIKKIEKNKKIIVLFGCGGDRDKEKRSEIGKICSAYADVLIITSDNSRGEEPMAIIRDILSGVDKSKMHLIIPSRKQAILYGANMLKEDNVLLLLGKGHENYEIDKNGKHFFDERLILDEAFKQ
ncbi:MAG: UDP-N-acetylmuramoyl-L-alanyl-D-glutamate--2,6-diaminopimelate ligase [Clostridia bacterium]|nr:UDP-N-acetylmuramoyl-L-alanyl-D-glutamate--2,6-diaminopimelate ligase [Clostridia bacterium]